MKIGFYPMVADILHVGHMLAIEEAKKNCDYLIIGLYCHPKTKNPAQSIYERYMQLRAVRWVDEVIPYENEEDVRNMISSLTFDVYFVGQDHYGNDFEGKDLLQSMNKEIYYIKRNHPYSSTYFKKKINLADSLPPKKRI